MLYFSPLKVIFIILWVKRWECFLEDPDVPKVTTYLYLLIGAHSLWEPYLRVIDINFNLIMTQSYRVYHSYQSLLSYWVSTAFEVGVLFKRCGEIARRPLRFHCLLVQTTKLLLALMILILIDQPLTLIIWWQIITQRYSRLLLFLLFGPLAWWILRVLEILLHLQHSILVLDLL